jgi:nonspecific dipeptidase
VWSQCGASYSAGCHALLWSTSTGSTDDKAPILAWLWAIEAFQTLGRALPVNVKFMLEGMEESGSEGLFEVVDEQVCVRARMCAEVCRCVHLRGRERAHVCICVRAVLLQAKPGKFLSDADFICISDNYWLGRKTPCVTYGCVDGLLTRPVAAMYIAS